MQQGHLSLDAGLVKGSGMRLWKTATGHCWLQLNEFAAVLLSCMLVNNATRAAAGVQLRGPIVAF